MARRVGFGDEEPAGKRRNFAKIAVLTALLIAWIGIGVSGISEVAEASGKEGFWDLGPFLFGWIAIETVFGVIILRYLFKALAGEDAKPPTDREAAQAREAAKDRNVTISGEDAV